MLAALSLPGKLAPEGEEARASPAATAAGQAAAERLRAAGWSEAGVVDLTASGLFQARVFSQGHCDDAALLTPVAANGELRPLLARIAGAKGRVVYLRGDSVLAEPPWLRLYVQGKLAGLAGRLGWNGISRTQVTAVVATGDCSARALPWEAPTGR